MSAGVIAVISVSIALVGLTCAIVVENRTTKSLSGSIVTVALKCLIAVILANVLETLHLLIWISVDQGIDVVKGMLGAMLMIPFRTYLVLVWREFLRLLPLGAIVALASSSGCTRFEKIVWASIAAAISGGVIEFLFPELVAFTRQPSKLFLVAACIVEGPIIGILVGPIGRIRINLIIPRRLVVFFAYVRKHLVGSTVVFVCVLVLVLSLIPRPSRVFLRLSGWREITIEYTDVAVVRNSPVVSLLFTLFNSWPVAAGNNIEWVSFKSGRKTLDFNFLIDGHVATSDPKIELAVSRVDDYPLSDDLLYYRYFSKLDLSTQLVYRGKTNPGTFTIDAPEFACGVYSRSRSNTKDNVFGISAPLRASFTVSRESQPTQLFVPGLKEVSATKEWRSVRASEQALAFVLSAASELTMFCRARESSSKEGLRDIRISGQGLAKPIVIGPSAGASKGQTKTTATYPGFVVEIRKPEGRVALGILGGSANIALGSSHFVFVGGIVRKIMVRQPNGSMKIDTDEVRQLDVMDELSFEGENLQFSAGTEEEITVQGQSRNITLNGRSLAKPILPVNVTNLIGEVLKFLK